jgi:hypothetical protein
MTTREDYLWDPAQQPDAEIAKIEAALRPYRFAATPLRERRIARSKIARSSVRWSTIAAAALLIAGLGSWIVWRVSMPAAWSVETLAGLPAVQQASPDGRAGAGSRVETDARSAARIAVGHIGVADIEPGSRVDVLRDDADQHRLFLRYGTLQATIWAAPRFFVVETSSATAIDLGCVYALRVDTTGAGLLAVSYGEVELAGAAMPTLVAAGSAARLYASGVPGLPYPLDGSAGFQRAVFAADSGRFDDAVLATILREPGVRATMTLWHLLPRVQGAARESVYQRIAELARPPRGVTRSDVLVLNASALRVWEDKLRTLWSVEPSSLWRKALVRIGLSKPVAMLDVRRAIAN